MIEWMHPLSWWVTIIAICFALSFRLLKPKAFKAQLCISVLGMSLVSMYFIWRVFVTILADEATRNAWWPWIVLGLELCVYYELYLFLGLSMFRKDRSAEVDALIATRDHLSAVPPVDVVIPTYNESFAVLDRTIQHAMQIDYPEYSLWVLDDGRREWLRAYCEDVGVHYVARDSNTYAKAGNLNHALNQLTGEFIAILDADFSALPSFLKRPIVLFDDPAIGVVQMPQRFFNPDPTQRLDRRLGEVPDEQRLWFDDILSVRDGVNLATSCGSCSIVRRAALAAIGDRFPTETITEDFDLSLRLLEKGIITRHLPEVHAIGLAAETVDAFFVQRKRWAVGNLEVWRAFLKRGAPLAWHQSLLIFDWRYILSMPARVVFLFVPMAYLGFGLQPLSVPSGFEVVLVHGVFLFVNHRYLRSIARGKQPLLVSEATANVVAAGLLPSVIKTIWEGARERVFEVTPKGRKARQESRTSQQICRFFIAVIGLNLLSIAAAVIPGIGLHSTELSDGTPTLWVAIFWACWTIVIALLSIRLSTEQPNARRSDRFFLDGSVVVRQSDGEEVATQIVDVSESGLAIKGQFGPGFYTLSIPVLGTLTAQQVGVRSSKGSKAVTTFRFVLSTEQRTRVMNFIYTEIAPKL